MWELVICNDDFWFTDVPKHGQFHIESNALNCADFIQTVESTEPGGTLYFDMNEADLDEMDKSVVITTGDVCAL